MDHSLGESLAKYRMIKEMGKWSFRKVLLATRNSAGGPGYNRELYAMKAVAKPHQDNVELEVFNQVVWHPYLIQLVSFF